MIPKQEIVTMFLTFILDRIPIGLIEHDVPSFCITKLGLPINAARYFPGGKDFSVILHAGNCSLCECEGTEGDTLAR